MSCFRNKELIRHRDRVFGVFFVPFGDEFIAGLADMLTVDDLATEDARHVYTGIQSSVSTEGDGEVAIQINGGREGAQPIHFDGASGAAELDNLVADFFDGLIDSAFDQTRGACDTARISSGF